MRLLSLAWVGLGVLEGMHHKPISDLDAGACGCRTKAQARYLNERNHTCDREPEPIRENRAHQNRDGQDVVMHVDTSWGPEVLTRGRSQAGSRLVDVPSMEGSGVRFVTNRFDVVPVRTNDKSCIVVRVVLRAQTRRTIVFTTCL